MTTSDEQTKKTLTPGTLIRFHNWAIGGFLFGVVTECDEEPYTHNKLHIWRPRATYSLNNIDGISIIESMNDVREYEVHDLRELLYYARNNVICSFNENRAMTR